MSTPSLVAAGFLQTILPVLVENLSGLAKSAWSREDSRSTRHVVSRYTRKFKIELKIYQDTFTKILEGIATGDAEVRRMIQDPEDPSWSNERLQTDFKNRLLETYNKLDETITKLNQDIGALLKRIDLSSPSTESDVFSNALATEFDEVFDRVRDLNNNLNKATEQNVSLESQGRRFSTSKYVANFKKLRQHVDTINRSLTHTTCKRSGCKYCQNLNFRLQPVRDESGYLNQDLLFGFFSDSSSWHQYDTCPQIPPLKLHPEPSERKPVHREHSSRASLSQKRPGKASTHRVGFQHDVEINKSHRTIENLCDDLTKLSKMPLSEDNVDPMTLGVIEGQNSDWCYSVTSMRNAKPELEDTIPLGQLLQSHDLKSLNQPSPFSPGDKFELAAVIALGALLLEGVWMQPKWDNKDILVTKRAVDDEDIDNNEERVVRELCFTRTSETIKANEVEESPDAVRARMLGMQNVLLRLAIALIEVSDGRTFDRIQTPQEREQGGTFGIRLTAIRVLPDITQSSGPKYSDVVKRCITCPFEVKTYSFDNEQFLNQVFINIVKPLVADYQWYHGFYHR